MREKWKEVDKRLNRVDKGLSRVDKGLSEGYIQRFNVSKGKWV